MVKFEEMVQWLTDNGDKLSVTMADIALVGIDDVLAGINAERAKSAQRKLADFFCDGAFDAMFDRAWAGVR